MGEERSRGRPAESQEFADRGTYDKGKGKAAVGDVAQQESSTVSSSAEASSDRQSNGSKTLMGGMFSGPGAAHGMLQDLAQGLSAAAGGKGGQFVSGSARLGGQGQALETLGASGSASGSQGHKAGEANGQFRSSEKAGRATAADQEAYEAFSQSAQATDDGRYDQISKQTTAFRPERQLQLGQVYSSAADFDAPLHAHVRASHLPPPQREVQEPIESLASEFSRLHPGHSGTDFEQAWSTAEQPHFAAKPIAPTQDSAVGFLAALEAEEAELGPLSQEPSLPALGNVQDMPLDRPSIAQPAQISEFLTRHVGVTPEAVRSGAISEEQYQMHLALDALQNSDADPARVSERLRPADDDEQARQGIYAPTPEEALRGILGGEDEVAQENARAQASKAEQLRRAQEVQTSPSELDRLRQYLPRGTFVDEVYGLPPMLARTLKEAEPPKDPQNETQETADRRAVAIRRLEALRKHLQSPTESQAPQPAGKMNPWEMESWMRAHVERD